MVNQNPHKCEAIARILVGRKPARAGTDGLFDTLLGNLPDDAGRQVLKV
jgi:hypothetical protein